MADVVARAVGAHGVSLAAFRLVPRADGVPSHGLAPDAAALVDAPVKLNNNLPRTVVINELEVIDVACDGRRVKPRDVGP